MAQPKTEVLFQVLQLSSYYSLQLARSCIAATSMIKPFELFWASEKSMFASLKFGISIVNVSTKLKAIAAPFSKSRYIVNLLL